MELRWTAEGLPVFRDADRAGLLDFHEVYATDQDAILAALSEAITRIPTLAELSKKTTPAQAKEQAGKSVLPITFWYLSATGSIMLLMYFGFGHPDMVGFLSNLFPLSISLYNLHLVNRERRAGLEPSAVEELPLSPHKS